MKDLELRLGLTEVEGLTAPQLERIEQELWIYLRLEGVEVPFDHQGGTGKLEDPAFERCPSCDEEGLIAENGCRRCVLCGYGQCEL